ncbi:pyruvate, water dikinase [Candidatus Magnetoovum chiemensis]|nr:pyruvate, water dikinase [Candidatus Magnetoovum chiemensis]
MNSNSNNNYFLLSRHFCSLTSRLGYHLASVEAIVGERAGENYAKFFFKGGAADYTRRAARTLFLSEILEEFGFRTEIIEDSLSARVDKEDALYMTKQLKLIGYVLMHSRQLDMIMTDKRSVKQYRERFMKEMSLISRL